MKNKGNRGFWSPRYTPCGVRCTEAPITVMEVKFMVKEPVVVCTLTDARGRRHKGVAICQPEDTFVESVGKDIARIKAEIKMYNCEIRPLRRELLRTMKELKGNEKLLDNKLAELTHIFESLDMRDDE